MVKETLSLCPGSTGGEPKLNLNSLRPTSLWDSICKPSVLPEVAGHELVRRRRQVEVDAAELADDPSHDHHQDNSTEQQPQRILRSPPGPPQGDAYKRQQERQAADERDSIDDLDFAPGVVKLPQEAVAVVGIPIHGGALAPF